MVRMGYLIDPFYAVNPHFHHKLNRPDNEGRFCGII